MFKPLLIAVLIFAYPITGAVNRSTGQPPTNQYPKLIHGESPVNATATQQRFAKYRKIEAYEIQPGMLAIPRYTADGEVCEIGLQRLLYSPDLVRTYAGLDRAVIDRVLDELVPGDERGNRSKDFPSELMIADGQSMSTMIEFENVSIQIHGGISSSARNGLGKSTMTVNEVVATVRWKQRVCQQNIQHQ